MKNSSLIIAYINLILNNDGYLCTYVSEYSIKLNLVDNVLKCIHRIKNPLIIPVGLYYMDFNYRDQKKEDTYKAELTDLKRKLLIEEILV